MAIDLIAAGFLPWSFLVTAHLIYSRLVPLIALAAPEDREYWNALVDLSIARVL